MLSKSLISSLSICFHLGPICSPLVKLLDMFSWLSASISANCWRYVCLCTTQCDKSVVRALKKVYHFCLIKKSNIKSRRSRSFRCRPVTKVSDTTPTQPALTAPKIRSKNGSNMISILALSFSWTPAKFNGKKTLFFLLRF